MRHLLVFIITCFVVTVQMFEVWPIINLSGIAQKSIPIFKLLTRVIRVCNINIHSCRNIYI